VARATAQGQALSAYFVTATGTDIGKTFVTAGLIRALRAEGRRVAALKPIVSGFDAARAGESDPGVLLSAMGERVNMETVVPMAPWRFTAPLPPDMAAAREDRRIDLDALIDFCRRAMVVGERTLFIEGVGGAMVPLDEEHTVLDWMVALDLPVLLVAGTYLGTISHTLTALDVLARARLQVKAIVLNESIESPVPAEETKATLARFISAPIHIIPRAALSAATSRAFVTLAKQL
jgi:dethiobiotin synthetase